MTVEIERIAAGLTEAQRGALLNARDMMSSYGGYPFFTVQFQPGQAWPEGIARFLSLTSDRLTPLGIQVRKFLEQRHAKD